MGEQDCFFWSRSAFFFQKFQKKKKKKKKKNFFQNRFKNIITFPKRHADNFLEFCSIVKTSYAFWSWICLWRFFGQISEQECFFREQECFFFSKISKKKFRPEAEISSEGRNSCRRQGSLLISLIKSILSGGPSRRQLYPSRWYRFFFSKKKL